MSTAAPPFSARPVTVTSEQAVIAYDRANPARRSPRSTRRLRPRSARPALNYPYVLTSSDPAEREAAREFGQELRQPYAASVVRYSGFRSADGASTPRPPRSGCGPRSSPRPPRPPPSEAQTTLEVWGKLGLGSRDLVLIDTSAAMAHPVAPGQQTTLEQELTQTAVLGLALFPDSTQMGEWQIGGNTERPALPAAGPARPAARRPRAHHPAPAAAADRRDAAPGHGPLALNNTILAAYKQMTAATSRTTPTRSSC